jgi:hypothetical protein
MSGYPPSGARRGPHEGATTARLNIGSRRAKLLCKMTTKERLDLIAEGLPIILKSAQGFWCAAETLAHDNPREADVLVAIEFRCGRASRGGRSSPTDGNPGNVG